MQIYCNRCGTNHAYTGNEIERLLHCLIGAYVDEMNSREVWPYFISSPCLQEMLQLSYDPEGYSEYCEGARLQRLNHSKG